MSFGQEIQAVKLDVWFLFLRVLIVFLAEIPEHKTSSGTLLVGSTTVDFGAYSSCISVQTGNCECIHIVFCSYCQAWSSPAGDFNLMWQLNTTHINFTVSANTAGWVHIDCSMY